MGDMCGDNRFEIIQKAKEAVLADTNIDSSSKEMEVLDSFLFRCWQMGWLDKYDVSKPKTNADRIRAMGDEELAHELALVASWNRSEFAKAKKNGLETFMMNWLKEPAKEDE